MELSGYESFYLVGLKGVAMTSLAQLLLDAGKSVRGSDVPEDFPTKFQLDRLSIPVDVTFSTPLPDGVDCVIYTGAHQGHANPQVAWAKANGIPTVSHAQALAYFFNQKKGIAVCGVGGKSTISAMITWILTSLQLDPSFSVGVGNIPGLDKTGAWTSSLYFVTEADEYVEDPSLPPANQVARFSFLKSFITVCPNLRFDHPDVYRDFDHTKETFKKFFQQTNPAGALIVNGDDQTLVELAKQSHPRVFTFGENVNADFKLTSYRSHEGHSESVFEYLGQDYTFSLTIPGKFNALNALAALAATALVDEKVLENHSLNEFRSTSRRFENIGLIKGVQCYDDYAHHPHEVAAAIDALNEWYPSQRKVIAFQSHTFSRTKELFTEFVDAFAHAQEVVMTDIFASAREANDSSISSTTLCAAIQQKYGIKAVNLGTNEKLAEYFTAQLKLGDVFLTLGAGDIYEVFRLI